MFNLSFSTHYNIPLLTSREKKKTLRSFSGGKSLNDDIRCAPHLMDTEYCPDLKIKGSDCEEKLKKRDSRKWNLSDQSLTRWIL